MIAAMAMHQAKHDPGTAHLLFACLRFEPRRRTRIGVTWASSGHPSGQTLCRGQRGSPHEQRRSAGAGQHEHGLRQETESLTTAPLALAQARRTPDAPSPLTNHLRLEA